MARFVVMFALVVISVLSGCGGSGGGSGQPSAVSTIVAEVSFGGSTSSVRVASVNSDSLYTVNQSATTDYHFDIATTSFLFDADEYVKDVK